MENNTVLSLSSDQAVLTSPEIALRNVGIKTVSVMSPVQAWFEIEIGRCGSFLVCYRLSKLASDDLAKLFRKTCSKGLIIFVSEVLGDDRAPTEVYIALPKSSGPETIVKGVKQDLIRGGSFEHAGGMSKSRSGKIR